KTGSGDGPGGMGEEITDINRRLYTGLPRQAQRERFDRSYVRRKIRKLGAASFRATGPVNHSLSHGAALATVLRASGLDFDVDGFLADCDWRIAKVFHRGEPLLPKTQLGNRKCAESGFNAIVSEAGFHEFTEQVEDAVDFPTDRAAEVRRLVSFPGVTGVVLDFALAWRDGAALSDQLPAELVRLAGACGIALELSHYPVSGGQAPEEERRSAIPPQAAMLAVEAK